MKKKLAMNNHIQTVSRVDDYDQTFNSNDETSRTILHRVKESVTGQFTEDSYRQNNVRTQWQYHSCSFTYHSQQLTAPLAASVSCLQVDKKKFLGKLHKNCHTQHLLLLLSEELLDPSAVVPVWCQPSCHQTKSCTGGNATQGLFSLHTLPLQCSTVLWQSLPLAKKERKRK